MFVNLFMRNIDAIETTCPRLCNNKVSGIVLLSVLVSITTRRRLSRAVSTDNHVSIYDCSLHDRRQHTLRRGITQAGMAERRGGGCVALTWVALLLTPAAQRLVSFQYH